MRGTRTRRRTMRKWLKGKDGEEEGVRGVAATVRLKP